MKTIFKTTPICVDMTNTLTLKSSKICYFYIPIQSTSLSRYGQEKQKKKIALFGCLREKKVQDMKVEK